MNPLPATGFVSGMHEGAAADAAGGRADHAEAQRGGHGRVHGAAAVAERVAAGPRAPPVVRGHGAVRRRHHLPAQAGGAPRQGPFKTKGKSVIRPPNMYLDYQMN